MWRLRCAQRDPASPPPRPAAASLLCGAPALLLSAGAAARQHDGCLVSAGAPGGRVVALHVDGDRVELREAFAGMPWRSAAGAALREADAEPLRRARLCADARAVILAADALYDVELDPLCVVRRVDFGRATVNATCVDGWGGGGALVGFSSGDVCALDLRDRSAGPLLRAAVPARAAAPAQRGAGVLSCCAVGDGFRVVCGVGDARGTVAVVDLRGATNNGESERKRTRGGGAADAAARAVVAGAFSTPTASPACDMRCVSGAVGLVDTGGAALLTSVTALETSAHTRTQRTAQARPHTHAHTRALRCDLTSDGRVLASTRAGPWAATLTTGGAAGPPVSADVAVTAPPGSEAESFASISCLGDFVCAQTVQGNAVCFSVCESGGISEPPGPPMRR